MITDNCVKKDEIPFDLRENIHICSEKLMNFIPYIEESLDLLDSLGLTVTEDVDFYQDDEYLREYCDYRERLKYVKSLGCTYCRHNRDKYKIYLRSSILCDKDNCTNTIIHELLHVKTKGKGNNGGHGKWWTRLAKLVSSNSRYNITRYYDGHSVKDETSFLHLTEVEQSKLFEKMKEENNPELFDKFDSVYLTLINDSLRDEYTIYYIENRILKDKDFPVISWSRFFPTVGVNDSVRNTIAHRYLTGKYDDLLDTPSKASHFHYFFLQPYKSEEVNSYSLRFQDSSEAYNCNKLYRTICIHTEQRF